MADELVSQGRRHLLCGEITQAVEKFQKACETLSSEFGDLDERLAEPNLLYGTALLELARMESTVLGNALDGVPENDSASDHDSEVIEKGPEMTEEEKEDISNQIIDAMCEKEDKPEIEGENEAEENANSTPSEEEETQENEEGNEQEDEADNEADGEGEEASTDDEDVTNLQLAWEVIEVAKRIFSRGDDCYHKSKVADCFEKLAEISREKEDYAQALADFDQCLSIRSEVVSKNFREIAETHFQIGTTHAVAGDLDQASNSFKKSMVCLQDHIKDLQQQINEIKASEDDSQKLESLQSALAEVEALIPDIERRLAEVDEDRMASRFVPSSSVAKGSASQNSEKATDDITHLVRKKRQVTDESTKNDVKDSRASSDASPVTKKTKLSNGHGESVNGSTESEKPETCNGDTALSTANAPS